MKNRIIYIIFTFFILGVFFISNFYSNIYIYSLSELEGIKYFLYNTSVFLVIFIPILSVVLLIVFLSKKSITKRIKIYYISIFIVVFFYILSIFKYNNSFYLENSFFTIEYKEHTDGKYYVYILQTINQEVPMKTVCNKYEYDKLAINKTYQILLKVKRDDYSVTPQICDYKLR